MVTKKHKTNVDLVKGGVLYAGEYRTQGVLAITDPAGV